MRHSAMDILEPRGGARRHSRRASTSGRSILGTLLTGAIELRDLYKYARLVSTDCIRPTLIAHYQGQLRVVDVLIDRMRAVGVDHIFAGTFVQTTRMPFMECGKPDQRRILFALLEAHDTIVTAAQPGGNAEETYEGHWFQDFAVGHVVLTNQVQMQVIEDVLFAGGQDAHLLAHLALLTD